EVRDNGAPMGWAVEGRPADCVKLALRELLPAPPDAIVSGLNAGSNAGINVLYSGTVAAAIEGAFFKVTSIACSLEYTKLEPLDFARGAALARGVVERLLAHSPAPGSLFNVNIPSAEKGEPKGVRVLRQNLAPYVEGFDRRTDPRGRVYFWSTPDFNCPDPEADTDVTALAEGWITVTPLHFNLTDEAKLKAMEEWDLSPR
ncbi:MAG: 5'/3'-nucleotidase SurE, partial [Gemmataceae bacterium]|nr:5'/3'-nucleotidase SurE [Gemmataceae bacterium]